MRALAFTLAPLLLSMIGCSAAPLPFPDELDVAFAKGRVCIAPQNNNSAVGQKYPVRFEFCLYRCIAMDAGATLRTAYQCSGANCQMTMLASAHVSKVAGQEGCDPRLLEDPPESECTWTTLNFDATVPAFESGPASGNYLVMIPYLTQEVAAKVKQRIDAGENAAVVMSEEIGPQNYPARQLATSFDPSYPALDAAALTTADCHDIALP